MNPTRTTRTRTTRTRTTRTYTLSLPFPPYVYPYSSHSCSPTHPHFLMWMYNVDVRCVDVRCGCTMWTMWMWMYDVDDVDVDDVDVRCGRCGCTMWTMWMWMWMYDVDDVDVDVDVRCGCGRCGCTMWMWITISLVWDKEKPLIHMGVAGSASLGTQPNELHAHSCSLFFAMLLRVPGRMTQQVVPSSSGGWVEGNVWSSAGEATRRKDTFSFCSSRPKTPSQTPFPCTGLRGFTQTRDNIRIL